MSKESVPDRELEIDQSMGTSGGVFNTEIGDVPPIIGGYGNTRIGPNVRGSTNTIYNGSESEAVGFGAYAAPGGNKAFGAFANAGGNQSELVVTIAQIRQLCANDRNLDLQLAEVQNLANEPGKMGRAMKLFDSITSRLDQVEGASGLVARVLSLFAA